MTIAREDYATTTQQAIRAVAESFHLKAPAVNGELVAAPAPFQMVDYGNPWKAGKASPQELQTALSLLTLRRRKLVNTSEDLRKLLIGNELGTDCSNFTYHCQQAVHAATGGVDYADSVFRPTDEVLELMASKPGWELEPESAESMSDGPLVSASRLSKLFRKKPQFIIGAAQMTALEAAQPVEASDLLPGDLISLRKIGGEQSVHVGVVYDATRPASAQEAIEVSIWHSMLLENALEGGVRQDTVMLHPDGSYTYDWPTEAHTRLEHDFLRPQVLAQQLAESPALQHAVS